MAEEEDEREEGGGLGRRMEEGGRRTVLYNYPAYPFATQAFRISVLLLLFPLLVSPHSSLLPSLYSFNYPLLL